MIPELPARGNAFDGRQLLLQVVLPHERMLPPDSPKIAPCVVLVYLVTSTLFSLKLCQRSEERWAWDLSGTRGGERRRRSGYQQPRADRVRAAAGARVSGAERLDAVEHGDPTSRGGADAVGTPVRVLARALTTQHESHAESASAGSAKTSFRAASFRHCLILRCSVRS
jgi:hypothetical protein